MRQYDRKKDIKMEKIQNLKELALQVREDIKDKNEKPVLLNYKLGDGEEYLYVTDNIAEDGARTINFEIELGGGPGTYASTEKPIDYVMSKEWDEKGEQDLLKLRFQVRYDDQWDYSHQMLNREETFEYFLRDTGRKYSGNHPEHIRDVPAGVRDEYMAYLKEELAEFWGTTVESVEKTYTVEDAMQEAKDALCVLEW